MPLRFHPFSVVVTLVCVTLIGCGSGAVQIPTSYSAYNTKDGTFACDAPAGWEVKGGGKGSSSSPVWAKFISGPALIHFKTSLAASLLSGPGGNRQGDPNLPPDFEPVHGIHVALIEDVKKDFDGYTEIAGSPIVMNCSLGPARLSEFTFETAFGGAMHGYRATIIGRDKGVYVYCICPESDWKALNPVFDKVLASIERGTAE
jgi:hypothetical protein